MSTQYPTAKQFFYTVTGSFDGTTYNPSFGSADYIVYNTVGTLGILDPDRSPATKVPVDAARYHTYVSLLILELDAGLTGAGAIEVVDVYTGVVVQTITTLAPGQSSYQIRTGFILYPGTVLRVTADKPGKLRVDQLIPDDATTLAFMQAGGGGGAITEIAGGEFVEVLSGTGPIASVNNRYTFNDGGDFTTHTDPVVGVVNLYNTEDGTFTVTLPAGASEGQTVIVKDRGATFAINALEVAASVGTDVEDVLSSAPGSSTFLTVAGSSYTFSYDSADALWRII